MSYGDSGNAKEFKSAVRARARVMGLPRDVFYPMRIYCARMRGRPRGPVTPRAARERVYPPVRRRYYARVFCRLFGAVTACGVANLWLT